MTRPPLHPLLVSVVSLTACFSPSGEIDSSGTTGAATTGTGSAPWGGKSVATDAATDFGPPDDTWGTSDSSVATADEDSGERPSPCLDACDPDLTATCALDDTTWVQCVETPTGCFDYELTPCTDGMCVPDVGCVSTASVSCADILAHNPDAPNGTYEIDPDGPGGLLAFDVVCDMSSDGGGWTLIARNDATDTFVTFDRSWAEYKSGFGEVARMSRGWLGNDRIHFLTGGGSDLRVLHDGGAHYYEGFSVANEVSYYQMVVTSTPDSHDGDMFEVHQSGQFFSTFDRDNDKLDDGGCAETSHTGWWHNACYAVSIAGSVDAQVHWRDAVGNSIFVEWIELWVR